YVLVSLKNLTNLNKLPKWRLPKFEILKSKKKSTCLEVVLKNYSYAKEYLNSVQNEVETQGPYQVKLDLDARYIILPGLEIKNPVFFKGFSAKKKWDTLLTFKNPEITRFNPFQKTNLVHFKRQLFTAKLKESELLSESFTKIKSITQKLYSMGSPGDNKDLAVASLISVPPLYKMVFTDIEHQKKNWNLSRLF
ncbi:hypothetical protein BB559_002801, partial [Furculomyces boomerangus]